jgi:hypothetical protein
MITQPALVMKGFPVRLLILFLLPILGCHSSGNRVGGLYSTDTLPLIPKSDTSENERKNRLIAFVGEKIAVNLLPHEDGSMDAGFSATYKILLRVYGNYSKDTITFTAYDHYGWPGFSHYKNVLLFVSEYEGKYYHQKYQFFDVYKTQNGRWASSYKSDEYGHSYNKDTVVRPVVIDFAEKVIYPTKVKEEDGTEYLISYPEPYYKTTGDSAVAIYGNYLEDLFELKRRGVLKARGLFGTTQEDGMIVQDVELEEVVEEDPEKERFWEFWESFVTSLRKPGIQSFRRAALDSVWCDDAPMNTDAFINKFYYRVFDNSLFENLKNGSNVSYTWNEASFYHLLSGAKKVITRIDKRYRFQSVMVKKTKGVQEPLTIYFDFIKTKKGYRFYGAGYAGERKCCE